MKLQLTYDIYQDRLLLKMALDETPARGFWLTRRMTALLWDTLTGQLAAGLAPAASAEARGWLLALQQEQVAAQHAPVVEPALALADAPLLVVTLKYGRQPDGRQLLGLLDAQEQGELYAVPDDIVHALLPLLQQKAAEAGWALPLVWPETAPVLAPPRALQ